MRDEPVLHPAEIELLRYVDGRLDAAAAAAMAERLREDPELARRVVADRALDAELKAVGALLSDPLIPERLLATTRQPILPIWPLRALAAVVLLTVGLGIGWSARGWYLPVPDNSFVLPLAAADAHRVFVAEVRHPVEVTAAEEAHLVAWLSKRLGGKVQPPPLDSFGYQLVGGRLLPSPRGAAAQFMYEQSSGKRLTLYVVNAPDESGETSFRFANEEGVSVFYWIDRGFGYALIADADRASLLPIARTVYERLDR